MKLSIQKIFLFLFLSSMMLFSNIDEQIEAMEQASEEERFEMMNRFKKELIKLQEEERIDAMKKLISITESNNSKEVMEELKSNSSENNTLEEHIEDEIKDDIEENIENETEEDIEYDDE